MKKISETIFVSLDDNFDCKELPKDCTVITAENEYAINNGIVTRKDFPTVSEFLDIIEDTKRLLIDAKRDVFDFYECDHVWYRNRDTWQFDIRIDLNDFSIKLKDKPLIDLDELGTMSEEKLEELDKFYREGIFANTVDILNKNCIVGDLFITSSNIGTAEANKLTDIAKSYLYALDEEVNISAPVHHEYDIEVKLQHTDNSVFDWVVNHK